MIAVTVVTPSYRHLEKEAVKRIKKFTGLKVKVIRCADKDGFFKKLELDRECGKSRVLFFDVDYWLLRPMDVQKWCPNSWMAVHDSATFNPHAFPHTDCEAFGMDKLRYFNSGMFTCNLALKEHRQVFQMARQLRSRVVRGSLKQPTDVTDQVYLNLAAQKLNLNYSPLPTKFNFYLCAAQWGQLQFIPRDIVGLHAAGVPLKGKAEALKQQAAVFGYDLCGIQPEVQFWDQARIFELR